MTKKLIATQTASSSSSLSFTSGIDSTYPEYEFLFINIHPSNDNATFSFQVNASGQTGFNEVTTSTMFRAYNSETAGTYGLIYDTAGDQAQTTTYQWLSRQTGADNDQSTSGTLTLYNPSSTTYVKHFTSVFSDATGNDYEHNVFVGGYFNITAAITEIDFKFSTGNIDSGTIKMFGVS